MEEAPTEEIFSQQGHPYTEALIETIPKINSASHTRLVPIPGQPPVTTSPPTGCPFADRCRYTTDRCVTQGPPLTPLVTTTRLRATPRSEPPPPQRPWQPTLSEATQQPGWKSTGLECP